MVSVGEPSGDLIAGLMVEELMGLRPELEVLGVAGERLMRAGVTPVAHVDELSVMGLVEVIGSLGRIKKVMKRLVVELNRGVDLLVVVDFSGFNIRLARVANALDIPVVFYVSPQVWAWRYKRAAEISLLAKEVLCLLPFEPEVYAEAGGHASFVGHPLAAPSIVGAAPEGHWLLLPGSREAEIERLLPVMVAVSDELRSRDATAKFVLGAAPGWSVERLSSVANVDLTNIEVVEGLEAGASGAKAALVASGTATLQLGCMCIPMVVVYKVNPLTHWLLRRLVKGVDKIALPNIVLNRAVVPEYIQSLPCEELADALEEAALGDQVPALSELRLAMSGDNASRAAAIKVESWLPTRG
jgi:lipid-A-disaccharide synthase